MRLEILAPKGIARSLRPSIYLNVTLLFIITLLLLYSNLAYAGEVSNHLQLLKNDESSIPTQLLREIDKAAPLGADPGMVIRLESFNNTLDAVIAFCATVIPLNGQNYSNLIRQLHRELIISHNIESGDVRSRRPYFLQQEDNVLLFYKCLEYNASKSSLETIFQLFQIEYGVSGRGQGNSYSWLVKAAKGGHAAAEYFLAETIWSHAYDPSGAPVEIREFITPERYQELLHLAAQSGNRLAKLRLANFHLGAIPAPSWKSNGYINIDEGLRYLMQLAEQPDDFDIRYKAIEMIGDLYFLGTEVPDDYQKSLSPFQHRSKDRVLSRGSVLLKNHEEALRWYRMIPQNELAKYCSASFALAKIYRSGQGVPVNEEQANNYRKIYLETCIKQ